MLKDLLQNRKCFKLVCGAGNEDAEEVEKLAYVYAKAGARLFDLSANEEVVQAAISGFNRTGSDISDYLISISVGIRGDPHISKASIDQSKCAFCLACLKVCSNSAIFTENNKISVNSKRCIGCGKCYKACQFKAVVYSSIPKPINESIDPLIKYNISCLELHAISSDEKNFKESWNLLKEYNCGIMSLCLDRSEIGNNELIKRVKYAIKGREDESVIIQADGSPMTGGVDDYHSTLQAVATAEIINNARLPVFVVVSGGTNSRSGELLKICSVNAHGVAIGSYARSIVGEYIKDKNFFEKKELIELSVMKAKILVNRIMFYLAKL
ncbi:MAG TPA: LdpA C-terminal domain-containing domain [Spirochaetota bacterium]|jgi:Fe-S-cluster-containing hydrogenase component 2|nr:MAG: 2-ketoisovalerate ferredoxin oxidoreductase subunit delta [Spirochaetes bacterium ADurb.Bin133]HNZ26772.1 LdpA C-terminal domain-containing domain [Spirochaetota bacterium]HPY88292.1 LdpA C-terminal domain-containing domain [Spirochaetota bacterium]